MRHFPIFAAAALVPYCLAISLVRRDGDGDEVDSDEAKVCYPAPKNSGETVAPCVSIANIEAACQPNGTDPVDYEAHAQCMCGGSYFADWLGCQDCLEVHGFRSQRDRIYWGNVMSAASSELCSGTPTAAFQSLFAAVQSDGQVAYPTSGGTQSSDQFPDSTAVSLYYTASGQQGAGRITGDAATATAEQTAATETGSSAASASATGDDDDDSATATTSGSDTATATATATEAAASSSSTGAAATHGSGLAMALAGAVLVAAM